ncbi:MAG: hypothetical protein AAGF99_07950 [Bacteroidota bacterium]
MDVEEIEIDDEVLDADPDARFYSCHVCGDNWLAVRTTPPAKARAIVTFIHQMGLTPTLKRIAYLHPRLNAHDEVERWVYFRDDDEIDEAEWTAHLLRRRRTLRSICTN